MLYIAARNSGRTWCSLFLLLTFSSSILSNPDSNNPHFQPSLSLQERNKLDYNNQLKSKRSINSIVKRAKHRKRKRATKDQSCIALLEPDQDTSLAISTSNATVTNGKSRVVSNSTSTGNTTCTASSSLGLSSQFISNNGIYWGFLPDNGDSGGSIQLPTALNQGLGKKAATIGLYAHIVETKPFDCVELTDSKSFSILYLCIYIMKNEKSVGGSETMGYSGLGVSGVKTPSQISGYKAGALLESVVASGSIVSCFSVLKGSCIEWG